MTYIISLGNKLPQTFCKKLLRISFCSASLWPDSKSNWVIECPYLLCSKTWSCHFLFTFSSACWIGLFCFSIWKQCLPFDHPYFCSVFHCTFADAWLPNIFCFVFLFLMSFLLLLFNCMAVSFNENELRSYSKGCLCDPLPLVLFSWVFTIKCTVFLPFKGPSSLQSKRLSQWYDFRPPSWQQRALLKRHQAGLIEEDVCILFCKDFVLCYVGVQLQQAGGFCALRQMNESSKGKIYFVSYFIVLKQLNSANQLFHRKWLLYFCTVVDACDALWNTQVRFHMYQT